MAERTRSASVNGVVHVFHSMEEELEFLKGLGYDPEYETETLAIEWGLSSGDKRCVKRVSGKDGDQFGLVEVEDPRRPKPPPGLTLPAKPL